MKYLFQADHIALLTRLRLEYTVRAEIKELGESAWNQHPYRRLMPGSPHREADDIILRFQQPARERSIYDHRTTADDLETVPYEAWWSMRETRALVYRLMKAMPASRLGRVVVTRLKPGKQIHMHADDGANAAYYDRFQICVSANNQTRFIVKERSYVFQPGEVWWFDNQVTHGVVNAGDTDRITIILDMRVEGTDDGWRNAKTSDHRVVGAVAA
jgi:quercetin dioxygenase-like cupin family protein